MEHPTGFSNLEDLQTAVRYLTIPQLVALWPPDSPLRFVEKRSRPRLLQCILSLPSTHQARFRAEVERVTAESRSVSGRLGVLPHQRSRLPSQPFGPAPDNASDSVHVDDEFLSTIDQEVLDRCIEEYCDKTSNAALAQSTCCVCAREVFKTACTTYVHTQIPNRHLLRPSPPHPAQTLLSGALLHTPAVRSDTSCEVCADCLRALHAKKLPPLSLANGLWVGCVPHELEVLTLPERILIAHYLPAAYIIKLYPKFKSASYSDIDEVNSALRGNVSTYPLNPSQVAGMLDGVTMPSLVLVLPSVIGITFVGPRNLPERTLPDLLKVRRHRVRQALVWLKANNPLYHNVTIAEHRLANLPVDAVPDELLSVTKYSGDVDLLETERSGYVPPADTEVQGTEDNVEEVYSRLPSFLPGITGYEQDQLDASDQSGGDGTPGVFPLHSLGVLDLEGNEVTDREVLSHALANTSGSDFFVRRGSSFVNEYGRTTGDGEPGDGAGSNPNHLLGAFPTLFPYGLGGFEVKRPVKIGYSTQAKWALQYSDKRFRRDLQFVFQAFGVLQKREVCRSACIEMKRSAFQHHRHLIEQITPEDLLRASVEEANHQPFSNRSVQALRTHLTAVRRRVKGTDESRVAMRDKVWGTTVVCNGPTLWITINPPDTQNPIAQVFVGEEIDLDEFDRRAGPDPHRRTANIATDPYAAARFFHFLIPLLLETLFGISTPTGSEGFKRRQGIIGFVRAYIGAVEAQGRGTLHFHGLFWICGAPSAAEIKKLLSTETFRAKVAAFVNQSIRADIDGKTTSEIAAMPRQASVSYSLPIRPSSAEYSTNGECDETSLARALQLHKCTVGNCLKTYGNRLACKRRAPWPTSPSAWVDSAGRWGPKRTSGFLNNWNPTLMRTLRGNHDIKLLTNGEETKDITWYITNYAAKKQQRSSNLSALLADRLAFHRRSVDTRHERSVETNKLLIQGCAHALNRQVEFSAPEAISLLMGWGDRYISHTYVTIHWTTMVHALYATYPHLAPRTASDHTIGSEGGPARRDDNVIIEVRDGIVSYRDQLKDYVERGDALEGCSFLDFMLNTYDAETLPDKQPGTVDRSSPRIPYHASYSKPGRCRLVRKRGHETLPRFVGPWFPRNDSPGTHEFYAASMLSLLQPWRSLEDLAPMGSTLTAQFDRFMLTATADVLQVVANIQYRYECFDASQKRHATAHPSENSIPTSHIDNSEPFAHYAEHELTADDVALARAKQVSHGELAFGREACRLAKQAGMFQDAVLRPSSSAKPLASTLDFSTDMIDSWKARLEAVTRSSVPVLPVHAAPVSLGTSAPLHAVAASVAPAGTPTNVIHHPATRSILNGKQHMAYDIITNHVSQTVTSRPNQLLMLLLGEGGTGKSMVINAITEFFALNGLHHWLSKTATSGVAASLIGGVTLHSWAGLPVGVPKRPDWVANGKKTTQDSRRRNIGDTRYLIIDECSMLTKRNLCALSQITSHVLSQSDTGNQHLLFGGLNVILVGDFHQFPPVCNPTAALWDPRCRNDFEVQGQLLYRNFKLVVALDQQMRARDPVWTALLHRLRTGDCTSEDIHSLKTLVITHELCPPTDFNVPPWNDSVLVTSRHGVRMQWNDLALRKHCQTSGELLVVVPTEDTVAETAASLTLAQQVIVAGMKPVHTGQLEDTVQLAVGMKTMVVFNLATEADVANGTRGTLEAICIDPREPALLCRDDTGRILLTYPPPVVIFRPDTPTPLRFEGLPPGLIPISPSSRGFTIHDSRGRPTTISRRQLAITPAYAFTDYRSQGQTLEHVIIDIARPPSGPLTPFSAYVALSRSRGRASVRLLRDFDTKMFTTHPSEELRQEDLRLAALQKHTVDDLMMFTNA